MSKWISQTLCAGVVAALEQAGIQHDRPLCELTPAFNLHLTDSRYVHAKLTRSGVGHDLLLAEVVGAAHARRNGLDVPEHFLTAEVIDELGQLRTFTAWQQVPFAKAPDLAMQVGNLLEQVLRIGALSAPAECKVWNLDEQLAEIENDLLGPYNDRAAMVLALARAQADIIRLHLDPARYVWLHGDPHTRNVLWMSDGSPVLIDWEEHTFGPREWDIAQVYRSIERFGSSLSRNTRECIRQRTMSRIASVPGINRALIDAFVLFRAASSVSYVLRYGENPEWLKMDLKLLRAAQTAETRT